MWCVFQATDDPQVHQCARCGFVAAPTRFPPEKVRRQCQMTAVLAVRAPKFADRVRSYREARERWIAAGRPVRTTEEMARLHEICTACEHFSGASCKLCGCAIHPSRKWLNKLSWATEHCPLDEAKW